jgi:hypothetical protein
VTKNSCTCPTLGELTKMIADEIKLVDEAMGRDERDVYGRAKKAGTASKKITHEPGGGEWEKRNGKIN